MSLHGYTGACRGVQWDPERCMGVQGGDILVDHGDHILSSNGHMSDELPTVVHEDMRLVWNPGDYSPWMSMDELLVKSLGLTKAYDTSQSYIQLQLFLLSFPDTFIIDNNIGGYR
jgi:hypothetical protein